MTFIIGTFQSHCKSEYNQVKWNKITRDMWKSDSIYYFFYKVVHCLNFELLAFEIYFLIRFIIKGNRTHSSQENSQPGSKINTIFHNTS